MVGRYAEWLKHHAELRGYDEADDAAAMDEELKHRMHCRNAVEYADQLGIYAVPCKHGKVIYWRPRTPKGHDPDLKWLLEAEPTHSGWHSWADAVVALGERMSEACGDCDACVRGAWESCVMFG